MIARLLFFSKNVPMFQCCKVATRFLRDRFKYCTLLRDDFGCHRDRGVTVSVNPRDYIKKMLRRDPELKSKWGTICPPVEMLAPDGNLCNGSRLRAAVKNAHYDNFVFLD